MRRAAVLSLALLILSIAADSSAFEGNIYINDPRSYTKELFALINHYRASNGLRPLSPDKRLITLAHGHCVEMQHQGVLSHDRFEERFRKSGRNSCVENVGWNYRTAGDLFAAWQRSSGHDQNMLSGKVQKAGISISGSYVTFFACN